MKRFSLLFYVSVSFFSIAKGQYAELIGKPYEQRVDIIHRLYANVVGNAIPAQALADTLQGMRTLAKDRGDKELLLEADLLDAYYDFRTISNQYIDKRLVKLDRVLAKGLKEDILQISCRAAAILATHYWDAQQYEKAFEGYFRVDSMLQQMDIRDFPNKANYIEEIGKAYYHFADYERAISYFKPVVSFPKNEFYIAAWRRSLNNMGLAYQKLNDLSRSDSCFLQLADEAKDKSDQWEGIASGNLGYNHYLRGDYDLAIPLFEKDIRIAEKYKDFGLAAGSSTPLADILIHKKELSSAKRMLDQARDYIQRSGQTDRLRLLYPVMSRWYKATGRSDIAASYLDSALQANEKYNKKYSALRLMHANIEAMAQERDHILQQQRAQADKQVRRRNILLSALVCIVFGLIYIAHRQRKMAKLKLKNNDLKLLRAEQELQEARGQLQTLAHEASVQEQEIQKLEQEDESIETRRLIEQLAQQVVLTDEGWLRFSELFGKVHPGFQHHLKQQYPELTPAEIRCLAMEKLRFSNKEMAALQGISPNAIMVTKHRIRKKLGLASQQDLEDFVAAT